MAELKDRHYILEGREIKVVGLMEWAAWFEKADRHVAMTTLPGKRKWLFWRESPILISTVFLGIDHGLGFKDDVILFETMVFGGEHDQEMERYSTYDQAEKGHERWVKKLSQ